MYFYNCCCDLRLRGEDCVGGKTLFIADCVTAAWRRLRDYSVEDCWRDCIEGYYEPYSFSVGSSNWKLCLSLTITYVRTVYLSIFSFYLMDRDCHWLRWYLFKNVEVKTYLCGDCSLQEPASFLNTGCCEYSCPFSSMWSATLVLIFFVIVGLQKP